MSITIDVPNVLLEYCAGNSRIVVKADTVRKALEQLKSKFPELYACVCDESDTLRTHMNLFVNNTAVRDRSNLATLLRDGDVLTIFQAVSGG